MIHPGTIFNPLRFMDATHQFSTALARDLFAMGAEAMIETQVAIEAEKTASEEAKADKEPDAQ